jgi:dephospho-CoA kinase
MLRVGLTGGIGSGKSTVATFFAARGVPIIDTDEIARELVLPGESAYREIIERFGRDILDPTGTIDRAKLRARVFNDAHERQALEAILHPRIRESVKRRLNELKSSYAIVVVPLLIETGFDGLTDRILVVDADDEARIERVVRRSGVTSDQVRQIMATQTTRKERLTRADDVIENNVGLDKLEQQVERLHRRYLTLGNG